MTGRAFHVSGTVQGVGFRPFVHRIATEEGLSGEVMNTGEGVTILAFGPDTALGRFRERLTTDRPALAEIERIEEGATADVKRCGAFQITKSNGSAGAVAVTADAATCADCLAELNDPTDRRYRYPFLNCVNCGPRFSIVESVPYDRPTTTMRAFAMCENCSAEYQDPADRRFHAEPIACPVCGPALKLATKSGSVSGDPIADAIDRLKQGQIIGVLGLGGFHLAVRAEDEAAVAKLRTRKQRPGKPFALMVRDLAVAARYQTPSKAVAEALSGTAAPIVIAPARHIPKGVAPGLNAIGVMLPSTPLHHLLLAEFDEALVMTSANRSGEPQVTTLAAAQRALGDVADAWLTHDRAIAHRIDDSVCVEREGRVTTVRRARGLAPTPIALPDDFQPHPPVLAMGGDLKNAFALATGGRVVLSPHIGDLESKAAQEDLSRAIRLQLAMGAVTPAIVAVDPNTSYRSSQMGERLSEGWGVPCQTIGHHHAHVAACLAENVVSRSAPPVLALTLDGLGVSEEGALHGCELWLADYREARRIGGLLPTALLGGDRAAKEPWRNLVARLDDAFGETHLWPEPMRALLSDRPLDAVIAARRAGINAPLASSAARLFDAVAATLRLCEHGQDYEGEAPMRLEALASAKASKPYVFAIAAKGRELSIDPSPMWAALADDLAAGEEAADISARFHDGFAQALCALVHEGRPVGCDTIVLTGGVFLNGRLARAVRQGCKAQGLRVLEHQRVSPGDGGLALGQAAVAIARMHESVELCA
ncbi:MAG: carbamoyltransferase HypF [Pseudomonadota bacterium]